MGFGGGLLRSVFQEHERWTKGLPKIVLRNTYLSSFNGTSTICWYRSNFRTTEDYISDGRMFARAWLRLTSYNLYMHPFGSLITTLRYINKLIRSLMIKKITNQFGLFSELVIVKCQQEASD